MSLRARRLQLKETMETNIVRLLTKNSDALVNPVLGLTGITGVHITHVNNNILVFPEEQYRNIDPGFSELFHLELFTSLIGLKNLLIDNTYGTWLSVRISIDRDSNTHLFVYNYDEKEEGLGFYSQTDYEQEFQSYPRSENQIPEWITDLPYN